MATHSSVLAWRIPGMGKPDGLPSMGSHRVEHDWSDLAAPVVKNLPAEAGDPGDAGLILGLGRSPGGGNGNLLQYSCLENPMDRRAWGATVHRVTKSQTWLKQLGMHACMLVKSRSQHWSPTWQKWSQRNGMSLTESASPLDSKDHEVGICLTHSWMLLGLSNTINTSWMIG